MFSFPILLRRRNPELFKEMLKGTDDLTEEMQAHLDQKVDDLIILRVIER